MTKGQLIQMLTACECDDNTDVIFSLDDECSCMIAIGADVETSHDDSQTLYIVVELLDAWDVEPEG